MSDDYLLNQILSIKQKRIHNELKSFYLSQNKTFRWEKFRFKTNDNVYLADVNIDTHQNITATFILNVTENKSTIVEIYFKKGLPYPFKPPDVKINIYNYLELLRISYEDLRKLNIDSGCLCCTSITCNNMWGPGCNMFLLFNEITRNLKIKMRLLERFLCKKIINKHFGFYLPIEEFL